MIPHSQRELCRELLQHSRAHLCPIIVTRGYGRREGRGVLRRCVAFEIGHSCAWLWSTGAGPARAGDGARSRRGAETPGPRACVASGESFRREAGASPARARTGARGAGPRVEARGEGRRDGQRVRLRRLWRALRSKGKRRPGPVCAGDGGRRGEARGAQARPGLTASARAAGRGARPGLRREAMQLSGPPRAPVEARGEGRRTGQRARLRRLWREFQPGRVGSPARARGQRRGAGRRPGPV